MTGTLAEEFDALQKRGHLDRGIPDHISGNLSPSITLRPYQEKALARFLYYMEDEANRPKPSHALFEMATGSGKTVVMAALILDLYAKGYRNFLFFVDSTTIIEKTRRNFLNPQSSKYLFAPTLKYGEKTVTVREVNNFDGADGDSINIHFSTIQGLHSRLNRPSENNVTYEDFEEREVVLLSDEAHHTNTITKRGLSKAEVEEAVSWEKTVERIFRSSAKNLLFEFTATAGLGNPAIAEKYRDKILYKYSLKEFRLDGYSKEVEVLKADLPPLDRAFQAVVLSQYRRKVAEKYGLAIKPVILMKSKTIKESDAAEEEFHKYIAALTPDRMETVARGSEGVVKQAFDFFLKTQDITLENLVREIRMDFAPEKCLTVNSKSDSEGQQIQLNTLEDRENEVRVIFAVDKLNEGWDVLNLYDIVRLYETGRQPNKTTTREAQLIGRGARYCPFTAPDKLEAPKYQRKYDDNPDHELKLVEELYYHCAHNPEYIQDIKEALVKSGIMEEGQKVDCPMVVKDSFKQTDFYKKQMLFVNRRVKNSRKGLLAIRDYLPDTYFEYRRKHTGRISRENIFDGGETAESAQEDISRKNFTLRDFPAPVLRRAMDSLEFFHFKSLHWYFPELSSLREFVEGNGFLASVTVDVAGPGTWLSALSNRDKLEIALDVLKQIEAGIKAGSHEHIGTRDFDEPLAVKEIVRDRTLKISLNPQGTQERGRSWKNSKIAELQSINLMEQEWFVYEDNFGTDQEKHFIRYISERAKDIKEKYEEFYLIRNEGDFKIYAFDDGSPLMPDFVLFARKKGSKEDMMSQIFIEPKGKDRFKEDAWKQNFLLELENKAKLSVISISGCRYHIMGLPFYNNEDTSKQDFITAFERALGLA